MVRSSRGWFVAVAVAVVAAVVIPVAPGRAVPSGSADVAAGSEAHAGHGWPRDATASGPAVEVRVEGTASAEGTISVIGRNTLREVVQPVPPGYDGLVRPQLSAGLGRFIYIYLDRGDWIYLYGLGRTVATIVLCRQLTSTLAGAIACGVASYIVGQWVIEKTAPPRGWCREFKFWYNGGSAGTKLVRRSC